MICLTKLLFQYMHDCHIINYASWYIINYMVFSDWLCCPTQSIKLEIPMHFVKTFQNIKLVGINFFFKLVLLIVSLSL